MNINVSVIIRAYNAEKYIEKSLQSVINNIQSMDRESIEVMVCYDKGSKDNTLNVLKNFLQKHPELSQIIKIVEHEHMSAPEALLYCLGLAQGDYIFLLDYDDLYSEDHIRKTILAMKSYNKTFGFTHIYFFDDSTRRILKASQIPQNPLDIRNLLHYNYIGTSSICIKRECAKRVINIIKKLHTTIIPFIREDWLIALIAFKECEPLFIADSAVFYRLHSAHRSAIQSTDALRLIYDALRDLLTLLVFAELEKDNLNSHEWRALEQGLLLRMHIIAMKIGKHLNNLSLFKMYHNIVNMAKIILGKKVD